MTATSNGLSFTVVAGKYDGYERNCKYIEDFDTLDAALAAYMRVKDYPWSHIEYGDMRLEAYKNPANR